ncbi:hypothetical protein UFOVP1451_10 [uncultured Caudovirales phage]|uniref:Uncharacterized protein n=1 Tax=uncultured Caudovirales phage TaxID=2100421 RepID=A0A6J5SH22_9CAUD|nr:hypothetical protein UFOVP1451_10 [uncultured Caudovirales phage]
MLSSASPQGYFVGQAARTATVNNVLSAIGTDAIDAGAFKSAMVQVVSTGTGGTYIFEGSNDNVNFQSIPVFNQLISTGTPIIAAITASASQIGYYFPVGFKFIRLRIATAITGGSIRAFSKFMQTPFAPAISQVAQSNSTNLNVAAVGLAAHSAASTGSPVRFGGRVNTTLDTTLVQGDACDAFMTTAGQHVVKPYGTAENDWQYAAAAGGITNSTADVAIKAAGAASIRNYITSISIMSEALATATELVIKEGASVIFRTKIPLAGQPLAHIRFPTPLKGAAATQLNVALLTASATGAVYFNAQGYQSF